MNKELPVPKQEERLTKDSPMQIWCADSILLFPEREDIKRFKKVDCSLEYAIRNFTSVKTWFVIFADDICGNLIEMPDCAKRLHLESMYPK